MLVLPKSTAKIWRLIGSLSQLQFYHNDKFKKRLIKYYDSDYSSFLGIAFKTCSKNTKKCLNETEKAKYFEEINTSVFFVLLLNTETFSDTEYRKDKVIERRSILSYTAFNSKIGSIKTMEI